MDLQLMIYLGIGGFALVVILGVLGFPIAFATAIVGIVGIWLTRGAEAAMGFSGIIPHEASSAYALSVLPLFVLMGFFAAEMGATSEFYRACRQWLGRLKGGLAMATVLGSAAFAACTGSGSATAALFGKMAYPEMMKYGYDQKLALGSVCCSAPLAIMIPPSALLIIYAIMIEGDVGKQLLAGFIPGLLTAALFMLMIYMRAQINPSMAPVVSGVTWRDRLSSLKGIWAISSVIIVVIGGLYLGVFTPTEAAAFGMATAFLIGVLRRSLSRKGFFRALISSVVTNSMLFAIIVGVFLFIRFLAVTRVPITIGEWIVGLDVPGLVIIAGIMLLCIMLGMFMDALGILILVVPVVFPTVVKLGFDPIWFGVLMVHVSEMGLVTPPIGLVSYALKGVLPEVPMTTIFRSIIPFELMMLVTMAVLMFFPQIALILPTLARGG